VSMLIRGMVRKVGLPPGTLLHTGKTYIDVPHIRVLEYTADDVVEKTFSSAEDVCMSGAGDTITWIRVIGLHNVELIEKIGECFAIHPLVLEDILNTNHRPKMEDYGDYLYIILKSFHNAEDEDEDEGEMDAEQVSLILGKNYVISFQEKSHDLFAPVRERISSAKGRIRKLGADYLAYALIDLIIDKYFVILEDVGERIEDMEDSLVSQPGDNALQEIHVLKRKMLHFRKALWPLREIMNALSRGESALVQESTVFYMRDTYDHTIQLVDALETYRDILSGMLDIYLSSVSNRMNQIMKVLTIISTIFIPLTFIAGVYGMNFKYMPELDFTWGYPAVMAVMLVISLGMIRFFQTRKWL
jgi:magnesium transporter